MFFHFGTHAFGLFILVFLDFVEIGLQIVDLRLGDGVIAVKVQLRSGGNRSGIGRQLPNILNRAG